MSDTLVDLVPYISMALLLAFLVHSYRIFRNFGSSRRFFKAWIMLWTSFALLYLPAVLPWGITASIRPLLDLFSSHLVALALFLCASALRAGEGGSSSSRRRYQKSAVAWTCVTLLSLVISALGPGDWMYASSSVLSFLGMALYASRHASAFPKAKDSILILLFVYAGLQLVYAADFGDQALALTAFFLSLPLKIVLYLSGYSTLYYLAKESGEVFPAVPVRRASRRRNSMNSSEAVKQPPEPEVTVELSGVLGFLYLAWRYPSGKALVFLLLASLLSGFLFLAENTKDVWDIGKELSEVLEE